MVNWQFQSSRDNYKLIKPMIEFLIEEKKLVWNVNMFKSTQNNL